MGYAQADIRQLQGFVVEEDGVRVKDVTVRLVSALDTLLAVTSKEGFYSFKGVVGTHVTLSYSILGYQAVSKQVFFDKESNYMLMPNVSLIPHAELIENVFVIKTIPVVYGQDTIQYNMEAFSFRKNALLEEALKLLPGISVGRDGTVYGQGKVVSTVLVDGKKFFGGDVLTATRNLPADFVNKIQLIDYYNDYQGGSRLNAQPTEKVINIILKEDKKQITFGQITAGVGTRDRFIGSAGINRFNDGQEFSIVGSLNNTNTSLFSFGAPSGVGSREQSLYDGGELLDDIDGLNNVKSLGFNFSDNMSENSQFNVSYNFTRKDNLTEGTSLLRSTYTGNRISNQEVYRTVKDDFIHRLQAEYKYKFRNKDLLEIKPVFTYSKIAIGNNRERLINNNKITNIGTYRDSSFNKSPGMDINLVYTKAFKKEGRKLTGSFWLNMNDQVKNERVFDYYYSLDSSAHTVKRSTFEQQLMINQDNGSDAIRGSLSYIEPFSTSNTLELFFDIESTNLRALRRVEDKLKSLESGQLSFVDSLAVNYNYKYQSSKIGLNYQYQPSKKFKANLGFAVQPVVLDGYLLAEEDKYNYSNVNLVPTAGLKWKWNDAVEWSVNYIGKNNQPDFLHIVPVRDNTNSQNIIIGNPALKAEFANRINTTFRKFITSRGQYFETDLVYSFIINKIVSDKRSLTQSTTQETSFKNADGYYDVKWHYLFNTPFLNESVQLDVLGRVDYYNNLSYVEDQRNKTNQLLYSQSLQVRYNWNDHFESVFNGNYLLNHADYSWPHRTKITAQTISLTAGTKGYLGNDFTLGAEMSQRFNAGYESSFMNNNPTLMNAYLEFTFFPNKLGMLRFQCFDLLDQNRNMGTYSEYVGNDLYEAKNNRLGRYFMITLNMRLQHYPKK